MENIKLAFWFIKQAGGSLLLYPRMSLLVLAAVLFQNPITIARVRQFIKEEEARLDSLERESR